MRPRARRILALLIAASAGAVAIACAGLLIHGYAAGLRQRPADEQRLKSLEQAVKADPAQAAVLAAEQSRQTQVSLDRAGRAGRQGYMLLTAAVLFLISTKWWLALRPLSKVNGLAHLLRGQASDLGDAGAGTRDHELTPEEGGPASGADDGRAAAAAAGHVCQCAPPVDLALTDQIIQRIGRAKDAAIPILQAIQSQYGYLPDAALKRVCEQTDIAPAQLAGVASFYNQFRRTPAGRHLVRVCHGTACHVAGAEIIHDEIRRHLDLPAGADTDSRREFTVESVACMGCCTLAPVVQIDQTTHGHLAADRVGALLDECLASEAGSGPASVRVRSVQSGNGQACAEIRIGMGSCCVAGGSGKVYEALERAVSTTGLPVLIKRVGCVGMCHRTPLVETVLPGRESARYALVRPEEAVSIVRRHFRPRSIGRRVGSTIAAAFRTIRSDGAARSLGELSFAPHDPPVAAFLNRQKRIVTEHCGTLDPTDFDEYVRHGGFEALRKCIASMNPQAVIDEIHDSGLRGRGGAGFPTGTKWARVQAAGGDGKYVICNGDEGDPGAFMDRMLMESFPYRIIEGMAIAAYAVGATQGYFYIRAEYPLAVRRIRDALAECQRRGLLGDRILGSDFSLRIAIMEGAGAFVCGEETALLASIEGGRGTPRLRPPFPAEKGLWGRPTLVNNVETLATVPWIIRNGAAALARLGTASSKGTKVFALAGKVRRGGLIEVPMGISIRQIVEEIGGGGKGVRKISPERDGCPAKNLPDTFSFKAVQIGGPSGGCVPADLADLPVDYEALAAAGAIMGSGGLVVLGDDDCMVDIARYFLSFTQDQSCGKCTFCRVGTRRLLDILDRICAGGGRKGDLEELEALCQSVKQGSLCGLGKTAPNPVLTTLRYFRAEYEAHLEGRCPARKCKALIRYRVTENCTGCTLCAQHCGAGAIAFAPYERHQIEDSKCTRCGVCLTECPEDAIVVESPCRA